MKSPSTLAQCDRAKYALERGLSLARAMLLRFPEVTYDYRVRSCSYRRRRPRSPEPDCGPELVVAHEFLVTYQAKAAEYLLAISYLLLFIPFWRYVQGGKPKKR